MKNVRISSIVILISIITLFVGCDENDGSLNSDNLVVNNELSSDVKLDDLPNIDISELDLSLQNSTQNKSTSINEVVEYSRAACVAKTFRNISIRLSKNADFMLELIKELYKKCDDFNIDHEVNYFKFENFGLPFFPSNSSVPVRIRSINNVLYFDLITGTSQTNVRDMQISIDNLNDEIDSTYKIKIITYSVSKDNPDMNQLQYVEVTTENLEEFHAKFKHIGKDSIVGLPSRLYKYSGDFISNSTDSEDVYNISKGEIMEDFTISGSVQYYFVNWCKYNETYGSSKYVEGNPIDLSQVVLESWDVFQNTIIEDTISPFYSEVNELDLEYWGEEFTFDFFEQNGEDPWGGSISETDSFIIINFESINLRDNSKPFIHPPFEVWNKLEDVTNCLGTVIDWEEQFNNID